MSKKIVSVIATNIKSKIHRNLTSTDIEALGWVSFFCTCYGLFLSICWFGNH